MKKSGPRKSKSQGKSIRHEDPPEPLMLGVAEESFIEEREAVYEKMFGPNPSVSHEFLPLIPHIDVYIHKPGYKGRKFYTLVSGGMSDQRMKVPRSEPKAFRRSEIVFYVSKPRDEYIDLIRFLARLPFEYKTWFGHWHTVPNGDPPEPLFPNTNFTALMFLEPPLAPDKDLPRQLRLKSEPVALLWLVPLTGAEYAFCLEAGIDALLKVFRKHQHPAIFDPKRRSYI